MDRRLTELRRYVRGWMGYFGAASQLKLFARLDGWIRRRIRMCYWKQWRRPKTRRRNLIQLGVPRRQAIRHARSRQSYWHMSRPILTILKDRHFKRQPNLVCFATGRSARFNIPSVRYVCV